MLEQLGSFLEDVWEGVCARCGCGETGINATGVDVGELSITNTNENILPSSIIESLNVVREGIEALSINESTIINANTNANILPPSTIKLNTEENSEQLQELLAHAILGFFSIEKFPNLIERNSDISVPELGEEEEIFTNSNGSSDNNQNYENEESISQNIQDHTLFIQTSANTSSIQSSSLNCSNEPNCSNNEKILQEPNYNNEDILPEVNQETNQNYYFKF
jgi:hypothetical protein